MLNRPGVHDPSAVAGVARATPAEVERAEQALLRRVAARELSAFNTLYRDYYPRLVRFLSRTVHRANLVDEILNDTMLVVWSRASSYNAQCKVSTWVFAIAFRKAMKALQRLDDPSEDSDTDSHASELPGPEVDLNRKQLTSRLRQAMDSLSFEHRAVVELTYFHGADYREIAQIVDCPVDTVKTRMFHARRRLKVWLAGNLEDWL